MGGSVTDQAEPVTVLCPECGELTEVKDVRALILALHLSNDCTLSPLLVHRAE
jgi:hypothetical protein